ncbi:MAG: alanine racemase [Alphaproteobacteria bacterium]
MIKDNSILKINTKKIVKNYNFFKKIKKDLIVAPTIKANGYGLGDITLYNLFIKKNCKHFFVASIEEGIKLKNRINKIKIYVLNGIQNYDLNLFKKNKLIPIVNSIDELNIITKSRLFFGVHIDTGINRLGIDYKHIPLEIYDNKKITLVLSHLSSADEKNNPYNKLQLKRFEKIKNNFKNNNIKFSLSNSNGVFLSKSYAFDMVRPGIALYGGNNKNKKLKKSVKPVIEFFGKIIQIKSINTNEFIGYNQTFKTNRKIKAAIIGVGYADGIPRKLSNKNYVYYKENKFKIIGRISMDSFTIDITNSKHNLKVGMYIEIINKKYDIEDFANKCETISNEVLTSIGSRVKRLYV